MCMALAEDGKREQRFAEIGEGNLNWPAILEAAETGCVEYLLVEQDNCYGRDPFESLAISYNNLKAMGYE
jgi:sugar phosphate isomerase/epimerase